MKAEIKNYLRRVILWAALALIALLIVFSIYGAFVGAQSAQAFFNSLPLGFFWLVLAVILVAGIALFHRLLCIRGLFLIHLGCMLVLLGGIWGSLAGVKIQDRLFGTSTIHSGQMKIYEGKSEMAVKLEDSEVKELPFAIKLDDFRLEHYQPGILSVKTRDGVGYKMDAEPGMEYSLGGDLGSVVIVRSFENFKLVRERGKLVAIDDPNGKPNAAIELLLKKPDGTEKTKYVFERFAGHIGLDDNISFSYRRTISDYISNLEVIEDGNVVALKSIEVNKPLHFGGYLFYQHAYDAEEGQYTILKVTSDKGLMTVYLGYILLCAGAFWHFWLRHVFGDREIED